MPTVYTVSQAAKLLGTSTATVRRMADDMAEILPDYQPIAGQARKLSTDDLKVLSALHTRLQASPGTTRSALLSELSRPDSEPLIIPDTLPAASPPDSPDSQETGKAIQATSPLPDNALAPFLAAHNDTQHKIDTLSARIEMLSAKGPPAQEPSLETWFAIAIGLAYILLLAGVTVTTIFRDSQATLITSVLALLILSVAMFWPTIRKR